MKIRTEYVFPPIPSRTTDWSAVDDDTYDGPGSAMGWGPTERAAIEDLVDQVIDRLECQIERLHQRIEAIADPHHD